MSFIIQGLDPSLFDALSGRKQEVINGLPVEWHVVNERPGFPCRITLDDARIGAEVLLLSYPHHGAETPYAQSGPIFVTVGQAVAGTFIDVIPPALLRRRLSLRAYDANGAMIDAVLVDGASANDKIDALFSNPDVTHIDAHNATRGCFAAHIRRHP